MFFRTNAESLARANELGIALVDPDQSWDWNRSGTAIRIEIEACQRAPIALARMFVGWLGEFGDCLLWVREFGIWPSREDMNLYYRLRTSQGDHRQLSDAPGHLFLSHERSDLASYVGLAIQFGWGAHLLAGPTWTYMFLSHDGWLLAMSDQYGSQIASDLVAHSIPHEMIKNESHRPQ
jgi:hypothetical protein